MSAMKSQKAGKSRLSGSASMSQLEHRKSSRSSSASKSVTKEKQGPIDWSSRGLKVKYRGEKEREAAWDLFLSASKYAEKSLYEQDFIIPTVKVERHPFYVSYYKHLDDENTQSSSRSKARLLQKRFVFDVQEIWLTNLEHLREHDAAYMGRAEEKGAPENVNRGNGLHNRRDVRAIESLESQVQSVSQKRAFANAYHTARLPNIQVVLDYEPRPTPHLRDIKCLPPTVESLMRNIRLRPDRAQDTPELFTAAPFPSLVYVLQVDRLLPSSDYVHSGALSEVLWRFSLYRNDDSSVAQLYLCREEDVAAFAARLIMNKASAPAHDPSSNGALPSPPALLCSGLVYAGADTVCLPCCSADTAVASTEEAFATISVAVLGLCRRQQGDSEVDSFDFGEYPQLLEEALPRLHAVRIELCVSVLGTSTNGRGLTEAAAAEALAEQKVYLECSPAELRYLLRGTPAVSGAPLGGPGALLWWAHPDRALDTWPLLREHLALERSGSSEDGGVQYSAGLVKSREQKRERGAYTSLAGTVTAEQVDGALSTLEALSCAQELIEALRLVELPTAEAEPDRTTSVTAAATHALHFEGSSATFFSHVEFSNITSAGSDEPSDTGSAHPPATPLLYFDNAAPVPAAGRQQSKTPASPQHPSGPNTRPASASQGHAGKDRPRLRGMAQFNSIMAPISDQIQAHIRSGHWERAEDSGSNLSLLASGALPTMTQVPGACEHGRRGIWFPDHNTAPAEYTQAAARYYREQRPASSHSILVNMTFALDTALLFDPLTAWEAFSSFPQPTPAEEVDGSNVPALTVPPETLKAEALVSPLQERVSSTVMVFTSLPVEGVDFMPLDTPTLPKGFRRHVPTKNRYGYREQVEVTLLGVDPVLATVVFGITRTGAVPNNTGVNNRNLWHNTLAITEHINRPRAPKDYHYILVNSAHQGSNEPTRYTTRMKADKMVGLNSSAFSTYEENYAAIQELRDVFNRQVALDAKIEKVENEIVIKQKLLKIQFQNQLQRGIEKKMRKATKSELGWRSRFKMSTLMEMQGNWERRRDDRTGMFFFHNLLEHDQARARNQPEQFLQSCQWEVPAAWDGNPLSTHVSGGREMARNLYPGQVGQGGGGPARGSGNASFGSLSAADMMSELNPGELDAFDLVPARWDPHPEPQHHAKHQLPPQVLAQGGTLPKHTETMGAFEQPPDVWMPLQQQPQLGQNTTWQGNASIGSITNPGGRPPRGASTRSVASDINSVVGNKSFAESLAPTIDTANLEHIAEQLVSSDELMRVIARRLGIPESQVVPADDLSSVFSVSSAGEHSSHGGGGARDDRQNPLHAPRDPWMDTLDEPEFDSDDDLWSDDEHEVGDFDEEKEIGAPEDMPQTQLEAAMLRRRELRALRGNRQEVASVPSQIPALDLRHLDKPLKDGEVDIKGDVDAEAAREEIFGWRRLPRPVIRPGFLADALLTHTKPPEATSSNTLNKPVFLMPISPVDACKYYPEEFTTSIESIFIPDAKKDMERSIATVERNIRREEELTRNLPTDDLLLFGEATEFTSADAFLARQAKEDQDQVRDPAEEAREKAILAAKSSNIAMMEDSLAMDADPNTTDEFGNTLLILAAQQGAKRMCKFLLRKGANINKQSIVGNTPLHYCYAYSNIALGEYLKSKGADDSIVNVDKLTCYEGLSMDSMKEFYGDDEEAHMVMPLADGEADSEDD